MKVFERTVPQLWVEEKSSLLSINDINVKVFWNVFWERFKFLRICFPEFVNHVGTLKTTLKFRLKWRYTSIGLHGVTTYKTSPSWQSQFSDVKSCFKSNSWRIVLQIRGDLEISWWNMHIWQGLHACNVYPIFKVEVASERRNPVICLKISTYSHSWFLRHLNVFFLILHISWNILAFYRLRLCCNTCMKIQWPSWREEYFEFLNFLFRFQDYSVCCG